MEKEVCTTNKVNKIISTILLFLITFMQVITIPINVKGYTIGVDGINLRTDATTLNVGDKVEVIVSAKGQNVGGVDGVLDYDMDVFEKVSNANFVELTSSSWTIDIVDYQGKQYITTIANSGNYFSGDLFKIVFTVRKQVPETTILIKRGQVAFADKTTSGINGPEIEEELTIKTAANSSTLTVNPNGGTWNSSTETQTITKDEGTELPIPDPIKPLVGNKIIYNANGGDASKLQENQPLEFSGWTGATITDGKYTFGSTNETITANYTTDPVTLPTPTKAGSKFLGWYTAPKDGTRIGGAGDTYTPAYTRPNQTINLFAQWEEQTYELTINPNKGTYNETTAATIVRKKYNEQEPITDPTPPAGYTITLDKNDGTGTKTKETQRLTFDRWIKTGEGSFDQMVYTFGEGNGTLTATYTRNPVNLGTTSRTGYTFDGWYTQAEDGAKIENPSAYPAEGDTTLYAHWTPNKYEIEFDANGGTVSETTREVTYDQKYGVLPKPTRPGYEFDGWYAPEETEITKDSTVKITEKTTLTAKWLGAEYTVRFDSNGGNTNPDPIKVRNEGTYRTLPTVERVGYEFKGWFNDAGEKITSSTTVNLTSDITLTAHWEAIKTTLTVNPKGGEWNGSKTSQTFEQGYNTTKEIANPTVPTGNIIIFDARNGNTTNNRIPQTTRFTGWTVTGGTFAGTTYTYGLTDGTLTATYEGEEVTLAEAPTKLGSTFLGWYTAPEGGTKVGGAGEAYKPAYTTPEAEITVYAQWQEQQYELTINPNGGKYNGTTNNSKENGKYGDTKTLQAPEAPSGYIVTLDPDYENAPIQEPVTQTQTFNRWVIENGEGSIDGNVYTFGEGNGQVKAEYTRNDVQLPTPASRIGYDFNGWYTTDGTKVQNFSANELTGNIALHAHWTPKQFKITFNPGTEGNLNETEKEKTVTYDEPYGELPTPTRDGYDFNGWYDETGKEIKPEDIVDIIEDTTLTAKWLGATYNVIFDYEGGTGTVQSKQVRNEGTYGTLPNATKEGHTFVGWYDEAGNKIDENTIVNLTSDITLHARYEINKYTVTFKNDDGTTIKTVTAEHGSKVEFDGQTPSKNNTPAGYEAIFNGWTGVENLESVTANTTVTATYTLTPIVYTITYENTKNSDISDTMKFPTSYTVEDLNIRLENLPNQEKLIFDGWYTTNDNNGEKVTSIDISKLGNITLYARWREDKLYLRSDVYKIGENDIDNYEEGDIYLEKIMPETTVAEFIENCESNGDITVINEKGEVLGDNDLVGTNMTIRVTRYDEEITLTAVVMGDLDGNGLVTVTDLSGINQTVLRVIKLEGAVFKAADLDDNNEITVTDLSGINQKILKVIEFKYDKKTMSKNN